jgi:carbamoyl-phosphate synthase large subunit
MTLLFTCAGRRNYLINYFKEALKGQGRVFAADKDATAPALVDADAAFQVSDIYETNYADEILELAQQQNVDAIISLNDLELPLLASKKTQFIEHGIKLLVSDSEVIDIAFDKYKTHQFIESLGLYSPKTYISLDVAKKAIDQNELDFPLILKPRWGSASIGIEFADSPEELDLAYNLLRIKLNKTILKTASQADTDGAILIQEKLLGIEYGLDVVNDLNTNYYGTFVREKLNMRSGETDKARSVIDQRFEQIGQTIGKNLKHLGNLDCDVFLVGEKLYVLELNPRFGGGYPFSHEAGVNTVAMYISWLKGEQNVSEFNNYKADVLVTKCDRILTIKT